MTHFTPLAAALGGLLIGIASTLLMLTTGFIAGVSGFVSRLLSPLEHPDWFSRLTFIVGLMLAPWLVQAVSASHIEIDQNASTLVIAIAGLLAGFGSVLGSGCTSGHGVCGLARLSWRSFVATGTFMIVALITVFISHHLLTGLTR
jgi:uncharacterized membrane protein YedE/YeeE